MVRIRTEGRPRRCRCGEFAAQRALRPIRDAILQATRELLNEMLRANGIADFDDIVSILFTTTPDLTATFPAEAR